MAPEQDSVVSKRSKGLWSWTCAAFARYHIVGCAIDNRQAPVTAMSYDNNGNLTSIGATQSYEYDAKNRMTRYAKGDAWIAYAYYPMVDPIVWTTESRK